MRMKKYTFLFLLGLTFVCTEVMESSLIINSIRRCENDEVICYVSTGHTASPFCFLKSKEDK